MRGGSRHLSPQARTAMENWFAGDSGSSSELTVGASASFEKLAEIAITIRLWEEYGKKTWYLCGLAFPKKIGFATGMEPTSIFKSETKEEEYAWPQHISRK